MQIQAYLRKSASLDRETERIGPFLATFTPHSANPYLNYAIPDPGAEPTADEVAALVAAFERRDRTPRLEYLPGLAPAVEAALLAGGFTVEDRVPLMVCPPGAAVEQPMPDGVELISPDTDDEAYGMLTVQREAFGGTEPAGEEDVAGLRRLIVHGGLAVLARDRTTHEPAGGGVCTAILDGTSEVAGVGVRERYRRRGIGGAITLYLTRAAQAAGAHTVFLTPGGEPQERIYARVGYRRIDSVLFMSRTSGKAGRQ
jgi:GNAT superfamily N-acetyltransferase